MEGIELRTSYIIVWNQPQPHVFLTSSSEVADKITHDWELRTCTTV